jgi:RND family efflux transporter MFP subunit
VTPAEVGKESPARGRRWGWVGLLVAALAAIGAAAWYLHEKGLPADLAGGHNSAQAEPGAEGADQGQGSEEPVPVETVRLAPGGIARISNQIGSVHPFQDADLYAKVSGYLKELKVDYGDRVEEGQLLAVIDDPEVLKEADRAAAAVAQSKAAVKQAEARIVTAKAAKKADEADVKKFQAEVARYTSEKEYLEKLLARHQKLVSNRALPQEVVDEDTEHYHAAISAEMAAHAAVTSAEAQVAEAEAKIQQAEADLAEAKANVDVSTANHAKAQVFVDYTQIRSPYKGVITRREFFPGAFIRSAAEGGNIPLLSVGRIDTVRVVTYVPDRDVPYLDVGDPAEVTLDALGSQVFKGTVSRFSDRENPESRTMYTEIDLPNPDRRIKPGMYGIAKIILDTPTKAATLPASCLVGEAKEGKGDVFVVKNGKAKRTQITIGADDGIRIEVTSGLSPEDEVITSTGSVSEGTPVRVVNRRVAGARAGEGPGPS